MNIKSFLITLVAGCLFFDAGSALAQMQQAGSVRSIRAYGLTIPKDQVFVQSAIDGHVAEVNFEEGQSVKAGDILVKLECGPAEARCKIAKLESEATGVLDNAVAELEVARETYERISKLYRQNAASEQEVIESSLRVKRATAALKIETERLSANRARYELAAAEFEQFLLRAPFAGEVVHVKTSIGSPVSRSSDLIQLVSLDRFRVDMFMPVVQANELHAGETIEVQVNPPFEQIVAARIVFCSPMIEAATGTTRVTLEIDNRELQLPAGVTVSIVE